MDSIGLDAETVKPEEGALGQDLTTTADNECEAETEIKDAGETPPQTTPLDRALEFCQAAQDFWQKGELENALQALDDAYGLILEVDTNDDTKLFQQKEDLRFLISKRILEIYASRHIVVNGRHHAIPVTLNKHVQSEINRFTHGGERRYFIEAYKRSGKYRPYIIEKLRAAGLPESLSWLPLIESGFKTRALSKARALGLWQFIPSTGYKFGLKRDMYIDERLDPFKATDAAIAYLKELHQIFGDWTTVLAAYNCGEGRVLRMIRNQNINYLDNFWDLYERLPWETARYVPRFLATLYIVGHPEKYGLDQVEPQDPMEFDTVEISRQIYLKQIARHLRADYHALIELNPELRYKMLPPEPYILRIPKNTPSQILADLNDLPVASPPRPAFVYHRVRRGETLSTIAQRYRTSMNAIARTNRINRQNYIVAGKLLKIPSGPSYKASRLSSVTVASAHVVQRGDNLWNIAKRYGTTTKRIQELNHLKDNTLVIGQKLKLPGFSAESLEGDKAFRVYVVQPGDSPYTIATRHNMNLAKLLRINRLNANSTIFPGQQIYVE